MPLKFYSDKEFKRINKRNKKTGDKTGDKNEKS